MSQTDLPASWRGAIMHCPYCSGSGYADRSAENMVAGGSVVVQSAACPFCDGSGDLIGHLLIDAYRRGRDHVLAGLKDVEQVRKLAVEKVQGEEPSISELKRSMGL